MVQVKKSCSDDNDVVEGDCATGFNGRTEAGTRKVGNFEDKVHHQALDDSFSDQ